MNEALAKRFYPDTDPVGRRIKPGYGDELVTSLRAALDDNRRAIDEAKTLDAPCVVLVVGALPGALQGQAAHKDIALARSQVRDGIADLLDYARQARMPLAIEPLHPMYAADRACVNTLEQALVESERCLQCADEPCVRGCPVSIDIPSFIARIAALSRAHELLTQSSWQAASLTDVVRRAGISACIQGGRRGCPIGDCPAGWILVPRHLLGLE